MPKIDNVNSQLKPRYFQKRVLKWFDVYGRKTLPWQFDKTPYRVWISEIMLQQTQVSTVIPYFERFLQAFPTVAALSTAPEDTVLHLWTGLGYYSRARNLLRSAQLIMQCFNGVFPDDMVDLLTLPGIGRSTAGAILAIAFEKNAPILDGNVKRVLVRFHGIMAWPGEKSTADRLWQIATRLTPDQRCGDYTQAMMDLGATICVRGKPHCDACPLQSHCIAYQKGLTASLPQKKTSVKIPTRAITLLVITNQHGHALLEKRGAKGVWSGLWSMPEMKADSKIDEILIACWQRFRYKATAVKMGKPFRHTFSHYHLDITPAFITINPRTRKVMEADQQIWYNLELPTPVGLPAPIKNLLRELSPCHT